MSDKIIYCRYNLFDLHQTICIYDPEEPEVNHPIAITTIDDLGTKIAEMCYKYDIYKVHLFGAEISTPSIIDDINKYSQTNYSKNKTIEIEVN